MQEIIINTSIPIWSNVYALAKAFIIVFVLFTLFNFALSYIRKKLLQKAKTKRQISNIEMLSKILKYGILFVLVIVAISSRYSSFKDLGIVLGALTAGLGFALHRPISSVAAWIMMVVKRPFDIGDRVIIGEIKGNVREISLTHIYLEEVGRYGGEEVSGRTVIIPNSKLFEENIINYSLQSDLLLGQVLVTVAYESNLDHAIEITTASSKKFTEEYEKMSGKQNHTRLYFVPNGIEIHVRYYVPVEKAQEIATNITKEIYSRMKEATDIEMSYPHTKIVIDKEFKI